VAELGALFERAGSGCFCRYWHFEDDKNAWLARLAFEPEKNQRELVARAAVEPLAGVIARASGGPIIGWMKLEPARHLTKIYAQRVYRALPGLGSERDGVFAVGCFLVDPNWRRRGVARALLRTGVTLARERGARSLEAFPRHAEGIGDEERWTGAYGLFTSEGFDIVHDQPQYPVLRRLL
jgi:GNAT superfamily N-acetyltransferase